MVEDMRERHKIATRKGRCPGCHEYRKPPNAGQPVPAQFFRCLPWFVPLSIFPFFPRKL
jgi:hypothetical protein